MPTVRRRLRGGRDLVGLALPDGGSGRDLVGLALPDGGNRGMPSRRGRGGRLGYRGKR